MTMTTGELDFDTLFRQFPGGTGVGDHVAEIPFLGASLIFWVLFLILMPILLSNLLVSIS